MADDLDIPQPNARQFDVGANPSGPNPLGNVPAPPPQAPAASATPAVNPAQAADVAHHYSLGKAVRSIFGSERNYSVDPSTGAMTETDTDSKPGQLFRNIVAATILGGAAAEKSRSKGFLSGAVSGGEAVINRNQAMDAQKKEQARKDFEQSLQVRRENREETESGAKVDMLKAQTALHNAQTVRENQLIQHESFNIHKDMADKGKVQIQPYLDAGSAKLFDGVSESEMNDLLAKNPNAANLLWEPTGTKIVMGKDGQPTHEMTYTAIDPKGKVKVTDAVLKQWKDAGLDKIYGSSFDALKTDKELSVDQYMAITHAEQMAHNEKLTRGKQQLDEEKEKAAIDQSRAASAHLRAEATKLARDNKKDSDYDSALDELQRPETPAKKGDKPGAGGDFTKLSPKSKFILGDHITKETDEIAKMLKTMTDAGQGGSEEAKRLYQKWESLNSVKTNMVSSPKPAPAGGGQPAALPPLKESGQALLKELKDDAGNPVVAKDGAGKMIWSSGLSPDQKLAATKEYGAIMPWDAVEEFSKKVGIKPEVGAAQLKAAGIQVAEKAVKEKSEPDLTLSD